MSWELLYGNGASKSGFRGDDAFDVRWYTRTHKGKHLLVMCVNAELCEMIGWKAGDKIAIVSTKQDSEVLYGLARSEQGLTLRYPGGSGAKSSYMNFTTKMSPEDLKTVFDINMENPKCKTPEPGLPTVSPDGVLVFAIKKSAKIAPAKTPLKTFDSIRIR